MIVLTLLLGFLLRCIVAWPLMLLWPLAVDSAGLTVVSSTVSFWEAFIVSAFVGILTADTHVEVTR